MIIRLSIATVPAFVEHRLRFRALQNRLQVRLVKIVASLLPAIVPLVTLFVGFLFVQNLTAYVLLRFFRFSFVSEFLTFGYNFQASSSQGHATDYDGQFCVWLYQISRIRLTACNLGNVNTLIISRLLFLRTFLQFELR